MLEESVLMDKNIQAVENAQGWNQPDKRPDPDHRMDFKSVLQMEIILWIETELKYLKKKFINK